jgi:hypothetical protein
LKQKHLAAIVAALALVLPSCGRDDAPDGSTPAAGTSSAEQSQESQTSKPSSRKRSSKRADNGDGGSSAAEAERAAGADETGAPDGGKSGDNRAQRKPTAPKSPAEEVAALSPAQRRALHRDLYEQGKTLCYTYGPEELARSYNIPSSDPEEIASQYARAYEKAAPALALPYQQGCLAGFKRYARNPPKN